MSAVTNERRAEDLSSNTPPSQENENARRIQQLIEVFNKNAVIQREFMDSVNRKINGLTTKMDELSRKVSTLETKTSQLTSAADRARAALYRRAVE